MRETKTNKLDKKAVIREKMIEREGEARVVRKIVLTISIVLFLLVAITVGGGYFYIKSALQPVDPDNKKEMTVEIPIGSSVTGIANILEEHGIIKDARVFKYFVKFKNESGFMAGSYKLSPSMTLASIIESLKTGKIEQEVVFQITIPEGKQLKEIAKIIAEKSNHKEEDVFAKLNDRDFIKALMNKYPDILSEEILAETIKYPLEGYLFPATYPFYKVDTKIEEIVMAMLDQTEKVISEYEGEMAERSYTPHKLLTIASLIEEEATEKLERDQIASVFYNRLDTGMPLQTDPTVLYAQGEHKDKVLYKDLEIDDPYNTYKYQGLTPGPIANAGTVSIEAALHPAETDFLYFLATASGDVLFSKTLEEHNAKKAEHIQ
jgi:UPF0755 protein